MTAVDLLERPAGGNQMKNSSVWRNVNCLHAGPLNYDTMTHRQTIFIQRLNFSTWLFLKERKFSFSLLKNFVVVIGAKSASYYTTYVVERRIRDFYCLDKRLWWCWWRVRHVPSCNVSDKTKTKWDSRVSSWLGFISSSSEAEPSGARLFGRLLFVALPQSLSITDVLRAMMFFLLFRIIGRKKKRKEKKFFFFFFY